MLMRQPEADRVAALLTDYYGLPLVASVGQDSDRCDYVELAPRGIIASESFLVRLTIGWRSLRGKFIPGNFAGPMIRDMGHASTSDKAIFSGIVSRMLGEQGTVQMEVNGAAVDPVKYDGWPGNWVRFTLNFGKSPLAINTENKNNTENAILHWGGRFMAAILAIAPLEELETNENINPEGLPEGAKSRVEVNKYERNRFNRAACIEILGDSCVACGFNVEETYGAMGKGFIHVHHVNPVSEIGAGYKINPVEDLIPLCPNCHAMVHRENPPLDIDKLKSVRAKHSKD